MRMIDLGSQTLQIMDTATAVDCGPGLRLRRTPLRSLVQCMVPACCVFLHRTTDPDHQDTATSSPWVHRSPAAENPGAVTGTFFGRRRGARVSFCLHGPALALALQLAVPAAVLAREMRSGVMRIALKCEARAERGPLLEEPLWCLFCNGRRVGFALRRAGLTDGEAAVLGQMRSVSVGAGVLPDGDVFYMRAAFERVVGSADSQSFHMLSPEGSSSPAQQLSVFLLRS